MDIDTFERTMQVLELRAKIMQAEYSKLFSFLINFN